MVKFNKAICIVNLDKPDTEPVAKKVQKVLSEGGIEFVLPGAGYESKLGFSVNELNVLGNILRSQPPSERPDLALVFGGDGTMIHTARVLAAYDVPLLGVHLGSVGFLSVLELDNLEDSLQRILNGECVLEDRILLKGRVLRNGEQILSGTAQNDIVIDNRLSCMIGIDLSINDQPAMNFVGDGLITATPTGSTAYSLSAGGPIVMPNTELIVATPISPHNLFARPIIIDANSELKVEIGYKNYTGKISFDGQEDFGLEPGDQIYIQKCDYKAHYVWIGESTFLNKLHRKFGNL